MSLDGANRRPAGALQTGTVLVCSREPQVRPPEPVASGRCVLKRLQLTGWWLLIRSAAE